MRLYQTLCSRVTAHREMGDPGYLPSDGTLNLIAVIGTSKTHTSF